MKKLCSILLALVLTVGVVAMWSVSASAEETAHVDHCVCGGHAQGMTDHTCETVTWTAWGSTDAEKTSLPAAGNYYLVDDLTISASVTIAADTTLNLCLNGHNITCTARPFSAKGTLNLTDCGAEADWGTVLSTANTNYGGIIYTYEATTKVTFYGGNYDSNGKIVNGGVLMLYKGSCDIYGGNLMGGNAVRRNVTNQGLKQGRGGTIYQSANTTLNMYGGTISGGKAQNGGGNLCVAGATFHMYDGTISGGQCLTNLGSLTDGYAANGGNVLVTSTANTVVHLHSGSITGGTCDNLGKDIYAMSSGTVTVAGDVQIDELYVPENITFVTAEDFSGSVGIATAVQLSKVTTATTAASAACFQAAKTGEYAQYVETASGYEVFVDSHAPHCLCGGHAQGMTDHTCETVTWTPWGYNDSEKTTLPSTDGNYYLVSDVTLTSSKNLPAGTQINICLNGHDVLLSNSGRINVRGTASFTDCGAEADWGTCDSASVGKYGAVFYLYDGAYLTVYAGNYDAADAQISKGGLAVVGNNTAANMDIYGGNFVGANLTLDNGSGLTTADGGVFMVISKSVLKMYGGTITGGSAGRYGGSIFLNGSSFYMYDGSITGAHCDNRGGGLYVTGTNSYCYLYGGTITGNTADGLGQDIYQATGNRVRLYGEVTIGELYIGSTHTFLTNANLSGSIGINAEDKVHALAELSSVDKAAFFHSTDPAYTAKGGQTSEGAMLFLDNHSDHCACGAHAVSMGEHSCSPEVWTPWGYTDAEKTSLPVVSGNYYLVSELSLSAATTMPAGETIRLCLNGFDINSTARVLNVRGTVSITDCGAQENWGCISATTSNKATGGIFYCYTNSLLELFACNMDASGVQINQGGIGIPGGAGAIVNVYNGDYAAANLVAKEDGSNDTRGGAFYVLGSSTLNIYGGTIHDGSSIRSGGLLYVNSDNIINIYGGTISGGVAGYNGGNIFAQGELNIYGGTITGGSATGTYTDGGNGGNIYVGSTGVLTFTNGTVEGGTALVNGGNLDVIGTLTMTGGSLEGGHARYGGNLYVESEKSVSLEGARVLNGVAHHDTGVSGGGNIYAKTALTLTDCTISGGIATSGTVDAEGNKVAGGVSSGGNIHTLGTLMATGCSISDGQATHGGNLRVEGKTTLTNCTISDGQANLMCDGSTNGNGGNMYSASSAVTTLTGCTVTGGEARRAGSIGAWGQVTITDSTVSGGHAVNAGGTLMTYNNGQLTLNGNTVITGGTSDSDGAAIYFASAAGKLQHIGDQVQVYSGTCQKTGDGIHLSGGTLVLEGNPYIEDLYVNNSSDDVAVDASGLTCATPIRVEAKNLGAFADSTVANTACFVSADPLLEVRYQAEKLILAYVELEHVYVATTGDDNASGSESAPVLTMARALNAVKDGGTIHIVDYVEITDWAAHDKSITVTGGELNVTAELRLNIRDGVHFTDMTLRLPVPVGYGTDDNKGFFVYCNGHKVIIDQDVTVKHGPDDSDYDGVSTTLYGGSNSAGGVLNGTDLTVLSGVWGTIFGGSNAVELDGDVHLTVGGKVDQGVDYISHTKSSQYVILGGSRNANITGTVYMNVLDGTTGTSIHGGSSGTCSIGAVELRVTGGNGMAIYGGGRNGVNTVGTIHFYYEGGTFEQVFGGSLSQCLTGDVNLIITGGNITRRVYGGCYTNREESLTGSWSATNMVTGNVDLIIGSGANIPCNLKKPDGSTYNDRGIYGHSRQPDANASDAENSRIIFLDKAAYDKFSSKLGSLDTIMKILMGSVQGAADHICYLGWGADDTTDVISATATVVTDYTGGALSLPAQTATLVLEGTEYTYEGQPITPASIVYSDHWTVGEVELSYKNNNTPGTATATATAGGCSVSAQFNIAQGSVVADVAQVITPDATVSYKDLQQAISQVPAGGYLKLLRSTDENVTISGVLYLDLNGCTLSGVVTLNEGAILYGMDSTTDDYDCTDGYGKILNLTGNGTVETHFKTAITGRTLRYLKVSETDGISFHRIYLGITHMTVRPGATGVGYTAVFGGDALVAEALNDGAAFGYGVWLGDNSGNKVSAMMDVASFRSGRNVTLLLKNFDIANYGTVRVYAEVYLQLDDGTVITSASYHYTLQELVEGMNTNFYQYTDAQLTALQQMCNDHLSAMDGWKIQNILDWTPTEDESGDEDMGA